MKKDKIGELIEKRKEWVSSSRENNFDFDSILAGQYNDPSHFLYEILQNAEDEGATKIKFILYDDKLDVFHNGEDFTFEDIKGITSIGHSKKRESLTAIGKFGVGFKSVFAVTQNPQIFCRTYCFEIEDFVIPCEIPSKKLEGTLIRIPFNHKIRTKEEISAKVSEKLTNMGLKTLLFLKNLVEIGWETPTTKGFYKKTIRKKQKKENVETQEVTIQTNLNTQKYLLLKKVFFLEDKNFTVDLAFTLDDQGNIIKEKETKLFAYFQTEKETFLDFTVHGPFRTTPNRENVPMGEEENKIIIKELASLVAKSLKVLKEMGYLNVNTLAVFPIKPENKEKDVLYFEVFKTVKEELLNKELLPTNDNSFSRSEEALLARGKELVELLDRDDIQRLFSRGKWLDVNITGDKMKSLRDYLMNEIKIPEINFEDFANAISVDFLSWKPDHWMINFYQKLLGYRSLLEGEFIKTKAIMRLEDGSHVEAFNPKGVIQVYLPGESKEKYKTIKKIFVEDERSFEFLEKIGIKKPDLLSEIKEFILPKYKKEQKVGNKEDYYLDFSIILKGWENSTDAENVNLQIDLKKTFFILATNHEGTEILKKPEDVYFNRPKIRSYFDNGTGETFFVHDGLFEKFEGSKVKEFLEDLGVEKTPRRIPFKGNLTDKETEELRGNREYSGSYGTKDYELDGLDFFLKQLDHIKSALLWEILLEKIEEAGIASGEGFFQGIYKWWRFTDYYSEKFDASFLKKLKKFAWLIDKKGNFRKPSEIFFEELSDDYEKESSSAIVLKRVLDFKPEIYEKLPKEDREKLDLVNNWTVEQLKQLIEKKGEEEEWEPELEPDEVKPILTPGKFPNKDYHGLETPPNKVPPNKKGGKEEDRKTNPTNIKKIGRWGEEFVFNYLKNYYKKKGKIIEKETGFSVVQENGPEVKVIWLNKEKDTGEGYDFVIGKDGEWEKYIEVKTKIKTVGEYLDITGDQWGLANHLWKKGEGEKYFIYVVENAGSESSKLSIIKNPVKLWKEGKLSAHPVRLRL